MDRAQPTMRGLLRDLDVETEVIIQGSFVEILKVTDRNFEEMKVLTHRLPTHRSFGDSIRGPRGYQNYYEVHYIVRGYPFTSDGSQLDRTGGTSSGRVLSPRWGIALIPLIALFLGILGTDIGTITQVVGGMLGLVTIYKLWIHQADKDWRARSTNDGTNVIWKGGAIASVLNQEACLKEAMPVGERKKVIISPKRSQGLIEVRSGIFDSLQEAISSIEVFDAYDAIAGHLRGLRRGNEV
jgi:hypothetical protein